MGMRTIKQIGLYATDNSRSMIFVFQLRTNLQHPCRIECKIRIRTIATFPKNIGVTFSTTWRQRITEGELQIKSKYLQHIRQRRPFTTEVQEQRFRARRSQVLVSYRTTSNIVRKNPIIKVLIINVCCARKVGWLIESMNIISQKIYLDAGPTRSPSAKPQKVS